MITTQRPSLRLISGTRDQTPDWPGIRDETAVSPTQESALAAACGAFGIGLLLETRLDAFPGADDAFLVVDSLLTVQTLSEEAATLLGVSEEQAVSRPVAQFLGPADAEAGALEDFLFLIRRASTDSDERHSMMVRPRNSFGLRLVARIAPCGPPRAAVVLLRSRALQLDLAVTHDG